MREKEKHDNCTNRSIYQINPIRVPVHSQRERKKYTHKSSRDGGTLTLGCEQMSNPTIISAKDPSMAPLCCIPRHAASAWLQGQGRTAGGMQACAASSQYTQRPGMPRFHRSQPPQRWGFCTSGRNLNWTPSLNLSSSPNPSPNR